MKEPLRTTALRRITVIVLGALLSGCAYTSIERAPAQHDKPWQGNKSMVASMAYQPAGVTLEEGHEYSLAELIDLGQRNNMETRQAWNRAREAALSVGLVEATFLPVLSASVIAGHQRSSSPSPLANLGGGDRIRTSVEGVVPALTLGWLLFDFGKREALLEGAEHISFASNVLFNAVHKKVIRDVTDQFYQYNTARHRAQLAQEALKNYQAVEDAVTARLNAGVATRLDLVMAQQAVAQAKLYVVTSQGLEKNAYLTLLKVVGVNPAEQVNIASAADHRLPAPSDPMTEQVLQKAILERDDVAAAYAALKAAEAGVKVAKADFMPSVFMGAVLAKNRTQFDVQDLPIPLPGLTNRSTSTGVLVGVSIPIFDGGLRSTLLSKAEIHRQEAENTLQALQRDALREIIAAETMLDSALQSYQTATDLVHAAETAYDAALDAYQVGVGTITMATEAASAVLLAKQAQVDAHSASLIAAANLAFVMGE
ncbi:TolC family protein [Paenalcaligenes sp. Me131]|uniref:TolC family protein n=1 Tax=Paenalcaligenes sp. Me131 TaxID=3392636 RepID=UPI003D292AB5